MDDRFTPRPVAAWYMAAASASLLFMVLGCAVFYLHVTANPATLPLDQRAMFEAEPAWVTGAFGLAVGAGLVGALLLVLKRKLAQPLLLVSLAAVLVWLAGLLVVPGFRDTVTTNDIAVAVVVAALTWTIFWFARHSRQRGWLR